jgi:hypothetical protein
LFDRPKPTAGCSANGGGGGEEEEEEEEEEVYISSATSALRLDDVGRIRLELNTTVRRYRETLSAVISIINRMLSVALLQSIDEAT